MQRGRSGGHHMSQGRWWEHGDGPSWLVEPEPRTLPHNQHLHSYPDPLASKYPTLAELSAHLRHGTEVAHAELVGMMAAAIAAGEWEAWMWVSPVFEPLESLDASA